VSWYLALGTTAELAFDPFMDGTEGGGGVVGADVEAGIEDDDGAVRLDVHVYEVLSEQRVATRGFGGLEGSWQLGDDRGLVVDGEARLDTMKLDMWVDRPIEPMATTGALAVRPFLEAPSGLRVEGRLGVDGMRLGELLVPMVDQRGVEAGLTLAAPRVVSLSVDARSQWVEVAPFVANLGGRTTPSASGALGLEIVDTPIFGLNAQGGAAVVAPSGLIRPEGRVEFAWHAPWLSTQAAFGLDLSTPWFQDWMWSFYWERSLRFDAGFGPYLDGGYRVALLQTPFKEGGIQHGGRAARSRLALGWEGERWGVEGYWASWAIRPGSAFGLSSTTIFFDSVLDTRVGLSVRRHI